ncbi:STAS domain-containing protein [Nocardioides insulae]|uniref:STAS domain-containing protein n=1 Tax=Nocardioides insulae TaxID=394734 RepID=UPI0004294CA6|nr:STAS domain-containing protein [Nocardioides insulae]
MDIVTDGSTLALRGELDARSTWEVRAAIYAQLDRYDDAVLDLSEVTLIDLVAIRMIAVATRRAASAGHHLTLRGCGPSVRRMLHLSKMRRMVEVEHAATA